MKNPVKAIVAAVFLAVTTVVGNVILVDDFTDPVDSHRKWLSNLDSDMMTAAVGGGTLTLANTSEYTGEYYHTFEGGKPETFTLSFILKSVSGGQDAGVLFCRSAGFNGYYLMTRGNMLFVVKLVNGSSEFVYSAQSFDLKPSDNKLEVRKNGSEFHLFVNDVFQDFFTDSRHPSGDVGFFIPDGVTASFGEFRMTDTFEGGAQRTWFTDDFNGNGLRYWQFLSNADGIPASIEEAGGVLSVSSGEGGAAWMYVNLDVEGGFSARVEARHVSGAQNREYGIILVGDPPSPGAPPPIVHFGIMGNRAYAVWRMGNNYEWESPSAAILGAPPVAGVVFVDTIEVVKRSGSSSYELIVNGATLTYRNAGSVVNFEVAGIGLFTAGGAEIHFDNFSAIKEGASVNIRLRDPPARVTQRPRSARPNGAVFYDLKGRRVYSAASANGRAPSRTAAGVYVNENRKDVLIRKRNTR